MPPVTDKALRASPQNRAIRSAVVERRVRSVTFQGTWPTGIHWMPGETKSIPAHYPGADSQLPKGLEEVVDSKEG